MASINLFKIDEDKKYGFLNELNNLQNLGEKEIIRNEKIFKFNLYLSSVDELKPLSWNWIIKEFDKEEINIDSSPIGIVTIKNGTILYAITFGYAHFKVDKYCDKNFGFDFAKRVYYEEIKTTTLLSPHSKRNKTISTFIDYKELEFDSGESYSKIKIKVKNTENLFSSSVEIGNSIKFNLKDSSLFSIVGLLDYVEETILNDIRNKIPLFSIIKDDEK